MIRNLQRIQVKIASDAPPTLNLDPFIEIFARWRKEKENPAEWVDLADYAHIPRGPGIVLVGQRCNFAFEMADPCPGVLYAARKGLTGSHFEKILVSLRSCLELSKRLVAEPEFPSGVHLRTDSLELRFNDRLEAPNTTATDEELRPAVRHALDQLFGRESYDLVLQADPTQCYGFSVRAKTAEPLDALLARVVR